MKNSTTKFKPVRHSASLAYALLIFLALLNITCEREKTLEYLDPCGPDGPPTVFVNQTGTMFYIESDNLWAISFLPECLVPYNFDTSYLAFTGDYPIPETLRIQGKEVIFSGEIKYSNYESDWSKSIAVIKLYDIELISLTAKLP